MAAGKPIVASSLPSIKEVLNPGNSILVEPDNPESLAQGINQALTDEKHVNKIVAQAKKDIEKYTWEKRVEKVINFVTQNHG